MLCSECGRRLLLRTEAPGRDLLPLIAENEKSAVRVAKIAKGTSLHAPAIDVFIEAIVVGKFVVPEADRDQDRGGASPPTWLVAFGDLAGLEGLARLLQTSLAGQARWLVLKHLDRLLQTSSAGAGRLALKYLDKRGSARRWTARSLLGGAAWPGLGWPPSRAAH